MATVRVATPADVPALVRVINLAYRVEDFFIDGDRTTEADVRAKMAAPDAWFLAVDGDEGALAAAVYLEIVDGRGHFALLSVAPSHQKRGLARLLIDAVEARCRAAGCRALDIEVVDLRAELPAFYARFDFAPTGTAPFPDPHKLTRPASLMRMSKGL